jgi:hypothetical protein
MANIKALKNQARRMVAGYKAVQTGKVGAQDQQSVKGPFIRGVAPSASSGGTGFSGVAPAIQHGLSSQPGTGGVGQAVEHTLANFSNAVGQR